MWPALFRKTLSVKKNIMLNFMYENVWELTNLVANLLLLNDNKGWCLLVKNSLNSPIICYFVINIYFLKKLLIRIFKLLLQ